MMNNLINGINLCNECEELDVGYERLDSCYGIVNSVCRSGAFLTLDNGQSAFCYNAGSVPVGTKIVCTVMKLARKEEGKRMLVSMDSRVDDLEFVY